MDNDDRSQGTLLTRRQLVALFGAGAAAAAAGRVSRAAGQTAGTALTPNCVAVPQQTEGPYFVDAKLLRSDLRADPATGAVTSGASLALSLRVVSIDAGGACTPLPGALIDVWQCDALGVYSDARDPRFDTRGQKFLRGYQVSDASGTVRFTTIYPGWYSGRAVHIHFKVRTPQATARRGSEFTSQLYFDEALTDRVHAQQPYAAHRGQRLPNERDRIFRQGGAQLMLPVKEARGGYEALFTVAVQPVSARL